MSLIARNEDYLSKLVCQNLLVNALELSQACRIFQKNSVQKQQSRFPTEPSPNHYFTLKTRSQFRNMSPCPFDK